jgi:hypothetical protein
MFHSLTKWYTFFGMSHKHSMKSIVHQVKYIFSLFTLRGLRKCEYKMYSQSIITLHYHALLYRFVDACVCRSTLPHTLTLPLRTCMDVYSSFRPHAHDTNSTDSGVLDPVHGTYSTNSKVLDPVHDLMTVHV